MSFIHGWLPLSSSPTYRVLLYRLSSGLVFHIQSYIMLSWAPFCAFLYGCRPGFQQSVLTRKTTPPPRSDSTTQQAGKQ